MGVSHSHCWSLLLLLLMVLMSDADVRRYTMCSKGVYVGPVNWLKKATIAQKEKNDIIMGLLPEMWERFQVTRTAAHAK